MEWILSGTHLRAQCLGWSMKGWEVVGGTSLHVGLKKKPRLQMLTVQAWYMCINRIHYECHSPAKNESEFSAGELFAEMHRKGPSKTTYFSSLLSACAKSACLSAGEQAHAAILKLCLDSNVFIGSALVNLYCKCGRISEARFLFHKMPERNVVTWNSIILGHAQTQPASVAFEFFVEMLRQGVTPTPFTLSAILVACSRLATQRPGIQIHCLILKFGFCSNVVVGTALVDMYSRCSRLEDSRRLFDEMPARNVVTWTSMVSGYAKHQQPNEAMVLVKEMQRLGVKLNSVTYNSLLSSFSSLKDLDHAKQVHGLVIREGLESDMYLIATLVTMYSKCGSVEDFCTICLTVSVEDQISYNSVIAGFSHLGDGQQVLERFAKMRRESIDMDDYTFASVLRAIGILSSLEEGMQCHALIFKSGYASNVFVQNGLVSMYARCGAIGDCKKVFLLMDEPDLVSWNSLLSGCAQHGYGRETVELFEEMRRLRIRPDQTTFLSVLSACSHVGLLEKGLEYFDLMSNGVLMATPKMEHYACIVDLLGRAGRLDEAESFIHSMPIKPGASAYRALLSACCVFGNMGIAVRAAKCLLELCPTDSATYILISNVFAAEGWWDDAAQARKLMSQRGVRKKPGCSCIEVNDTDVASVATIGMVGLP